jgi:hypothetical protein
VPDDGAKQEGKDGVKTEGSSKRSAEGGFVQDGPKRRRRSAATVKADANADPSAAGPGQCPHGLVKLQCSDCKYCMHGRYKYNCKDCGGAGICEHGREKRYCRDCGGAGLCEHGRRKYQCKECRGPAVCEHGRQKYFCRDCGGAGLCEHGHQKYSCKVCKGEKPGAAKEGPDAASGAKGKRTRKGKDEGDDNVKWEHEEGYVSCGSDGGSSTDTTE